MPDSVTSRDTAAAGPSSSNAGGQPLRTKAEKRAEAKAARERALARQKRRRAFAVGGAAVVVLALLVGLIVWAGRSSSPPSAAAASTAAGSDPASGAGFPPVPAGADPALSTKPVVTGGTGKVDKLKVTTLIQGTGAAVQAGQTIDVNYVGVTYADGKEFDASWNRSEAYNFQVGAGNVIQGWDQGLVGVKVGSRVQLDLPADLAYGDHPTGGQPPGALRFVVDVLSAA